MHGVILELARGQQGKIGKTPTKHGIEKKEDTKCIKWY